jgi:trans-2,3-dihydro-3-hydroxyanthranilate isomerase
VPHPIYIVDVFAETRYAGNQLAVITGAGELSTATMQAIARETNFSETTFVLAGEPGEKGWPVRIFTPVAEIPFAGHPTLGTADVIRREILGRSGRPEAGEPAGETVVLDLAIGSIPVRFDAPGAADGEGGSLILWMRQRAPSFDAAWKAEGPNRAAAAAAIGLEPSGLDPRFPVQAVSTGLPVVIVPLRDLATVQRAHLDVPRYRAWVETIEAKNVLLFAPQALAAGNDLHVRVFAEYLGVPEDPATGSANGCLAAYLAQHRYFGEPSIDIRVEQGHGLGRPSLLRLRADAESEPFLVEVGGRVVPTIRGRLET